MLSPERNRNSGSSSFQELLRKTGTGLELGKLRSRSTTRQSQGRSTGTVHEDMQREHTDSRRALIAEFALCFKVSSRSSLSRLQGRRRCSLGSVRVRSLKSVLWATIHDDAEVEPGNDLRFPEQQGRVSSIKFNSQDINAFAIQLVERLSTFYVL